MGAVQSGCARLARCLWDVGRRVSLAPGRRRARRVGTACVACECAHAQLSGLSALVTRAPERAEGPLAPVRKRRGHLPRSGRHLPSGTVPSRTGRALDGPIGCTFAEGLPGANGHGGDEHRDDGVFDGGGRAAVGDPDMAAAQRVMSSFRLVHGFLEAEQLRANARESSFLGVRIWLASSCVQMRAPPVRERLHR